MHSAHLSGELVSAVVRGLNPDGGIGAPLPNHPQSPSCINGYPVSSGAWEGKVSRCDADHINPEVCQQNRENMGTVTKSLYASAA